MADNSSNTRATDDIVPFLTTSRLKLLVIAGVLGVVIDLLGFSLFGIQTVSGAVGQFLIIVLGGYLGFAISDIMLDKLLSK